MKKKNVSMATYSRKTKMVPICFITSTILCLYRRTISIIYDIKLAMFH